MRHSKKNDVLINITDQNGNQVVDARELHSYLGVQTRFNDWITRRIEEYGFVEKQDFEVLLKNEYLENQALTQKSKTTLNVSKDYIISLDMAKELAMVEKTEKR